MKYERDQRFVATAGRDHVPRTSPAHFAADALCCGWQTGRRELQGKGRLMAAGQAYWPPPCMGTREFRALDWLASVEPPTGIVIPPTLWMPAARASGLKIGRVKRLARRAADAGDPRLAWYAEHRARLRRRTPRGPGNLSRARKADRLRRRGLSWRRVALACGYSEADSGHSARKAARLYRERLADGGTLHRARKAYQRRERGEAWARIAGAVGYASARSARVMARRHAERAGLPWPVPIIENDERGT